MTRKVYFKDTGVCIYVDTNVLRNYCTGQKADVACLNFLFSKRKRNRLFTSTLAIGQTLSAIQKKNGKDKTLQIGQLFNDKMTFIDFTEKDVINSYNEKSIDIEDNMHFVVSRKKNCAIIITNDKTGFKKFDGITVIKPTKLGLLQTYID
ncbi:MAG: type II toxin-antitoxin system VapC family toxin [Candidatus Symbiothrix sp.]|jgi:predicted nucleic acid-binding protein|nr:type II toxin-antitoxin system VapC family toxin [Candidatus Symbiothrix sp.]